MFMNPTLIQLSNGMRKGKKRQLRAPAFEGAPNRKAIVYALSKMAPRKPNSARRRFVKARLLINKKRVFAKVPGIGEVNILPHFIVFVRGHGPKDSPGVNYHLVRGMLDFDMLENFERRKRRSKFGVSKPPNPSK
jgi:small subunit ribosomal protein S12